MELNESLSDAVAAVVRLADAADRAVFLAEALAVNMGLVVPEDVGMEVSKKKGSSPRP